MQHDFFFLLEFNCINWIGEIKMKEIPVEKLIIDSTSLKKFKDISNSKWN